MYITEKTFGCDLPVRDLRNLGRRFCLNSQDLRLIRIAMGNPRDCGTSAGCKPWSAWQARAILFFSYRLHRRFRGDGRPLAIKPVWGAGRSASVCDTVQHTQMWFKATKPTWQRSNATPPPRHATPEPVPSRVLDAGYRRAVKVGAVMRLKGPGGWEAGGFSEASIGNGVAPEGWTARIVQIAQRLCPTQSSARNSPRWRSAGAGDGSHGNLLWLGARVLRVGANIDGRWERHAQHACPLPRTGIFCWTGSVLQWSCAWLGWLCTQCSARQQKTGPSKSESLGPSWALLATLAGDAGWWRAARLQAQCRSESMMARAAPEMGEMGTVQGK